MRNRNVQVTRHLVGWFVALAVASNGVAHAQAAPSRMDALQNLNGAVTALVKQVSRSVVQVIVTSYEFR